MGEQKGRRCGRRQLENADGCGERDQGHMRRDAGRVARQAVPDNLIAVFADVVDNGAGAISLLRQVSPGKAMPGAEGGQQTGSRHKDDAICELFAGQHRALQRNPDLQHIKHAFENID